MNNVILVAIPVSIIIINGPLLKNLYNRYKFVNTQPKMRADICYKQKPNYCPMSSYKQCTNNFLPITPCQCEERSYELCPVHQRVNQKMFQPVYNPFKKPIIPKYIPGKPRVNMYQSNITQFDKL